jgi:arylsulfatase A-like enzyme
MNRRSWALSLCRTHTRKEESQSGDESPLSRVAPATRHAILPTLALVWLAAAAPARAEEARPNILFCFADDWGRYASVYTDVEKRPSPSQVVRTPNIDRVAREGVLFRHAFVNAPSCTPCRSALLSGRYFFNTGRGAILQGAQWDAKIPTYPLMLREAGYHIGKSFKVWSPGTPADAPFGEQKFAYQKAGGLCNNFSENVSEMVAKGTKLEAARDKVLSQVRDNFAKFLADAKAGRPWHYWFGPTTVHRQWVRGSGKALWGIDPDALKGKLPAFLPDVPEVREDFADYLGEVQAFDSYIGVLLKKLEEAKQLDRTLIVVSGDHGPPGFPRGKCNLYDFGVGVTLAARWPGGKGGRVVDDFVNLMDLAPTFLEAAGVKRPDGMNGKSLLGVLKSDKGGLVDPTRNYVVTGRERHVAAAREGNLPYPQRALRTRDFLYIRNFKPDRWPMGDPAKIADPARVGKDTFATFADMDAGPTKAWLVANRDDPKARPYYDLAFAKRPGEELYDLRTDPDQVRNVAEQPAYAAEREAMAKRLLKLLEEAGDPRVSGDGLKFERPPFTDPNPKAKKK